MKVQNRLLLLIACAALLVFVVMIVDSALRPQHVCEECGSEMQPFEFGSSIYKCSNPECKFMVDEGFQSPNPGSK